MHRVAVVVVRLQQDRADRLHRAEVDLFEVVEAIRMRPTHSNIRQPGVGVGGYCLTKDSLLADWDHSEPRRRQA